MSTPSELTFVQLSDTHVVARGATYVSCDSARYLRDAIAAVNALEPPPAFAVVTGDLCHAGSRAQYENFVDLLAELRAPYFVVPGNHDNLARLLEVLPPATYGGAGRAAFSYTLETGGLRLIALDSAQRGLTGSLGPQCLDWLAATLAANRLQPTIVALHQPPFRTGMHFVDVLPYPGAERFRAIVAENPQVALVLGGHIHCVRAARWNGTLAMTAPSTAPQVVPELFERRVFALRDELPGFVVHRRGRDGTFEAIVYRREPRSARYVPTERAEAYAAALTAS